MWHFPNCLGAIDGKHVVIDAPANSGSLYFNYKKTFSVVLLALVDAHYRFIAVDIGSYGKNSDGGIFANSNLGQSLDSEKLNIPEDRALPGTNILAPYVILGDEAFPLKKYLMRPFPGAQSVEDVEKRIFNYRLCSVRRLVECAFGILSQTFRIYCRRLKADPQNVNQIILTTCILHNVIRNSRTIISDNAEERLNTGNVQNLRRHGGNARAEAFVVRDIFKQFFNSPVGAVPWQYNKI
ncbi:hypothetical protein RI129_002835 [Pyrocoelia pectoralis]|uniref:DDE Tnp4 domain-containing protein n=1 Tax=Pyrocoelia pectoralis TaxID=417401 RepID=A0AAN7VNQ9_9COLE